MIKLFSFENNRMIEYTKHYYIEGQRICSKLGGGFQHAPVNPESYQIALIENDYNIINEDLGQMLYRQAFCAGMDNEYYHIDGHHLESIGELNGADNSELNLYFYHSDHLGSSSFISDASGYASQHLQYLPFGETFVDQRNTTYNTPFKFSAKEKDEETGYSYFGARYYWPEVSVWLSVDPLSDKYPSLSAYMYCAGNPVMLVDPDGRSFDEWDYDINTKEMTWVSDKGGKERQYVNIISDGKQIAEGSVSGDEVFVYGLKDAVILSNKDLSFNDENYNRNSNYQYSNEEFSMRTGLFKTKNPIKSAIIGLERNGNAQPLSYSEEEKLTGYTNMRLRMIAMATCLSFDVMPSSTSSTNSSRFRSSKIGNASIKTTGDVGISLKGHRGVVALTGSNGWNRFLQANKGVYSGQGWQKRAAAAYYKSKFYRP